MNYDLKPLTLGNMIGRAFNIYFDNFTPIIIVTLITQIPGFLMQALFTGPATREMVVDPTNYETLMGFYGASIITSAITVILSFIESGVLIKIISRRYLNKEVILIDTIKGIMPFILPLLGLSILMGLLVFAGLMLFVIPGIILGLGFCLSTEVMIVEGKGIIDSLKRSWALTKGRRLQVLGFIFVMWLIVFAASYIPQVILNQLTSALGNTSTIISAFITYLISAFVGPLFATYMVLIYFNMRIEKEGFAIEHLTNEFSLANAESPDDEYL